MSPSFTSYEAGKSPDLDGDTKVCLYKFCWVPSHYGIEGNKKADFAKSALDLPRTKVGVSYTDFKHLISQYSFSTWQDDWNGVELGVSLNIHSFIRKE